MGTTPQGFSTSAALLFTEQELGGPCTEIESLIVVPTTPGIVLAGGNGDRVGLIIMNLGGNDIFLSLQGVASSSNGMRITNTGGSVSLTVRDDFTLTSRQWSACTSGSTSLVYVLEIIRFRSMEVG